MIYDHLTADHAAFLGPWFVCGSICPARAVVKRRGRAITQTPGMQAPGMQA